ncbi:uncharacterized protein PHACADRAFT_260764 [Phanerochaete carnosa HHB-10118-sp]|uniref:Uncharacterized protein n=1 Tax=Phanerochaete carnosa (strain HHB-10118-sp) TaxID=650164 RepID=K5W002_PHACS|nr:uncharacterized protein PHACADRAFT_260764 [Phanerochaete carnosa HHB-10118-sp]EKM52405.1 hypothetical protein PHACADRAFT_260764 [Phanerochaete carnosa HHB-10118-sp]
MCLRRENRPLKDFLKPLPPPSAPQPRHDREASPHPSHSTTRSEQMRQTIFLPTLPIAAPQHPPAVYTVPGVPTLAHPGGDGLAGVAAHPPGFSGEMRGMHGHKFCTPPLYDAKDAPPRYEEAVLHGPGASDASSPGRPPGVGRQELRRSASQ